MINRENLERLATYLQSLPRDYKHFEMRDYFSMNDNDLYDENGVIDREKVTHLRNLTTHYGKYNGSVAACGTVACAVGHGPSAGLFMTDEEANSWSSWPVYGYRLFTDERYIYEFLFGSTWASVDNHHWGAAARIRYVLSEGDAPSDWASEADDWSSRFNTDLYKEYRINKQVPLPEDFYTFEMRSRMEEGKKLFGKLMANGS